MAKIRLTIECRENQLKLNQMRHKGNNNKKLFI